MAWEKKHTSGACAPGVFRAPIKMTAGRSGSGLGVQGSGKKGAKYRVPGTWEQAVDGRAVPPPLAREPVKQPRAEPQEEVTAPVRRADANHSSRGSLRVLPVEKKQTPGAYAPGDTTK